MAVSAFIDYLLEAHFSECVGILAQLDPSRFYSLNVDFLKLLERCPDVCEAVLANPITALAECDAGIVVAQERITLKEDDQEKRQHWSVKRNVRARFSGLPVCPELHRSAPPRAVDLGLFIRLTGTVVRTTQARMVEWVRQYACSGCGARKRVEARYEERHVLRPPTRCEGRCRGTFVPRGELSRDTCRDYQEIKIQERTNRLSVGSIPGAVWATLQDDLVDCCKPGDDVHVCGVVRRRWRGTTAGKRAEVELVLDANHVEVVNSPRPAVSAPDVADCFRQYWQQFQSCPLRGRDNILAAVCPQVYGMHAVKLALLLTLISGCSQLGDNERRSNSHLLLVGDPGTGKSQLLRAAYQLAPRAVLACGAGSTRAGLTCAALKEDGEWQLEAGALVLADGGICCVDELGRLKETDRAGVHEAMEQQTLSVAKAGMVCKLSTRCSVIAACNPRGHYDPTLPLAANVALASPLLSRFDLVFLLLDSKDDDWDQRVSSYILREASSSKPSANTWSAEKLQMYIARAGLTEVSMSKAAKDILQAYYVQQRSADQRDASRTTARSLDSLVRLSAAHSRLMGRDTVGAQDAVEAVRLVEASTRPDVRSARAKYPDLQYLLHARSLLRDLRMTNVWSDELLRYSQLLGVDSPTLTAALDRGSTALFARFEQVHDENIPLSCSLVTSSYFKKSQEKRANEENDGNEKTERAKTEQKNGFADSDVKVSAANVKDINVEDSNKNEVINIHSVKAKKVNDFRMVDVLEKLKKKEEKIKQRPNVTMATKTTNDNETSAKKRRRKAKIVDGNDSKVNNKESTPKRTITAHSERDRKLRKIRETQETDENTDTMNIHLNHVPSVNDIFADLGLDFNFPKDNPNQDDTDASMDVFERMYNEKSVIQETRVGIAKDNIDRSHEHENVSENQIDKLYKTEVVTSTQISQTNTSPKVQQLIGSKRVNKLDMFRFESKKDFSRLYEPQTSEVKELSKEIKSRSLGSESAGTSSQISIFETGCDIDLEI